MLSQFEARVRTSCPEHLVLAGQVRDRLSPDRWVLEWHLPWWAGRAFGLDPQTCRELVLSNVLGLGSIRLLDDVLDGELAPVEVAGARALAGALYEEALEFYRLRFARSSALWSVLRARMTEWRSAAQSGSSSAPERAADADLAARAAPLKISAYAVCELSGRLDAYESVDRCLDHALRALVRYDDYVDWVADVAAGRGNAFVTYALPQSELVDRPKPGQVTSVMLRGRTILDYFALMDLDLDRAASFAAGLDIEPLAAYLAHLRAELRAEAIRQQRHFSDLAQRASRLLLDKRLNQSAQPGRSEVMGRLEEASA